MTFTINPFVLGIIVTIASELLALVILIIAIALKEMKRSRTHENMSK